MLKIKEQMENNFLTTVKDILLCNKIKTLYINFTFLPFKQAIKFPIIIFGRMKIKNLGGNIKINADKINFSMIKVGVAMKESGNEISKWFISGSVLFVGSAFFSRGGTLVVNKNAVVEVGDNFYIGVNYNV